jgi:Flp pilus assembly protein protease CpaA
MIFSPAGVSAADGARCLFRPATMRISNRLVLVLIAGFFVVALAVGLPCSSWACMLRSQFSASFYLLRLG